MKRIDGTSLARFGHLQGALLALFIYALCAGARAEPCIAREGRPQAEIIISPTPARMTRLAARELQAYVEKISGVV